MAEKKYLGTISLALLWEKIKNKLNTKVDKVDGKGLSSNDYTSDEKTKLANIAAGAQVNVLEGIQKNGDTVTITNKIANISVPTKTSDITNDSGFITTADIPEGAAASTTVPKMDAATASTGSEKAFARGDHVHPTDTSRASQSDMTALTGRVDTLEDAVGTGGSVDTKITNAIQDLDSSIAAETNKAIASVTIVDGKISTSTKVTIPTNNNQLTNGAGYQTATDVSTAIADKADKSTTLTGYGITDAYTKTQTDSAIDTAIADKADKATTLAGYGITNAYTKDEVTQAIADAVDDITSFEYQVVASLPATGEKGIIYLVAHSHGTGDSYDEYIWLGSAYEKIGNTDIDLSGYQLSAELVEMTSTDIDTICV